VPRLKKSLLNGLSLGIATCALLVGVGFLKADSIRGSGHDLSTNYDPISSQVCMYCHTPHHANNTLSGINAPLWNRVIDRTKVFTTYTSPTMNSTAANPNTTISVLCLGCHDGSVSYGTVYGLSFSDKHEVINGSSLGERGEWPNCDRCHQNIGGPEKWHIGQNLSTMHPIALPYPTAGQDPKFRVPPDLQSGWPDMKLFNGKVECASCHKVHDPAIKPFLRKSNSGSELCLTCHIK
jgi:predicted CXXCH cytochrome family protein